MEISSSYQHNCLREKSHYNKQLDLVTVCEFKLPWYISNKAGPILLTAISTTSKGCFASFLIYHASLCPFKHVAKKTDYSCHTGTWCKISSKITDIKPWNRSLLFVKHSIKMECAPAENYWYLHLRDGEGARHGYSQTPWISAKHLSIIF